MCKDRCSVGGGSVIVYPMFNFAPKLYHWFLQDRMRKLYRRLRIVEKAMQKKLQLPNWRRSKPNWKTSIAHRQSFQSDTRKCFLT